METISVTCNHCGAPLTVGESTRFATCKHCGRQLKIVHGDSSTYTEVLEGIAGHTEQIARDTSVIRLQNELEQIDREWQAERERFVVRGENGSTHEPSTGGAVIGLVVAIIISVVLIAFGTIGYLMGLPVIFPIFVGLMIALIFVGVTLAFMNAENHGNAAAAYQQRRSAVIAKLREAEGGR